MAEIPDDELTTLTLQEGPLDGQQVTVPLLTAALIVMHQRAFHRYRRGGHGLEGEEVQMIYDGPASPEVAGFTEAGE